MLWGRYGALAAAESALSVCEAGAEGIGQGLILLLSDGRANPERLPIALLEIAAECAAHPHCGGTVHFSSSMVCMVGECVALLRTVALCVSPDACCMVGRLFARLGAALQTVRQLISVVPSNGSQDVAKRRCVCVHSQGHSAR